MKIEIRDRDRRALLFLALAIGLYGVISELALPVWDRLQQAPGIAAERELQLQRYRRALVRQGRYEELEAVVEAREATTESVLIVADNASLASVALQDLVDSAAEGVGISFEQRDITGTRTLDDFFSETAMSVRFVATPNQMVMLLEELRGLQELVTVRQIRVQPVIREAMVDSGQDRTKDLEVELWVAGLIETPSEGI